jgi:GNAT superfamily N-acetyltransferase
VTYRLRPAHPADQPTVEQLWTEASRWLAEAGQDQWQYPPRTGRIAASIAAGNCFVVDHDDDPAATITVDLYADPEFWLPGDDPAEGLYVHRLIVARSHAGAGLGSALLDWASGQAQAAGLTWLRADCWRTNTALRAWYEGQGFALVRDVNLPHRGSGALFQRRAGVRLRSGAALTS